MVRFPGNLMVSRFGFRLDVKQFEPTDDPAWAAAPESLRQEFRDELGRRAATTWQRFRAKGYDRAGNRMIPIGRKTAVARRDNINRVSALAPYSPMGRAAPFHAPLQATGMASRTQTLLRWRPVGESIWFYWADDPHTGRNWGEILDRHRQGFTQYFRYPFPAGFSHVPGRDVFGFSPAELKLIGDHMARWWSHAGQGAGSDATQGGWLDGALAWWRRRGKGFGVRVGADPPIEPPPVRRPPRRQPRPDWKDRIDQAIKGLDDYSDAGTARLRQRERARWATPPPWQAPPPGRTAAPPRPPRLGR
jgi:hypothetical protein